MSPAPVRVLINALHAKTGGGITYLRNVLTPMAEDGRLELHLALHRDQVALFPPLDPRIRLHVLDFAPGLKAMLLWEQLRLPGFARALGADLIYSPANFGTLFAANQVVLLRNSLEVARSETRWSKRLYWWALTALTWASVLRARHVLAVSAYALDSLTLGLRRFKRATVVHHGVDARFTPDPAVAREDFVLVVADIYVQKNLLNLVRAWARLRGEFPALRLKVAGAAIDADYHARVLAEIRRLGVESSIEFLGRQPPEALADLYRRCRLFVFPSTAETFGIPLVEAMACGAPVACSRATAMPEVAGDAALFFDPLDPADIAAALRRLLTDEALRADLARKGMARAAGFTWAETARRTAEALIGTA